MKDVQLIADLVQEYWDRGGPGKASSWYQEQLRLLQLEIGEERVERARDEYEERRIQLCSDFEDRMWG